jgi:predicted nuclease of restriction endonuclease-like (RecB) superfamily
MSQITPEYKKWLTELKTKIRSVQLKAAVAVNSAMIEFYWEIGKMIAEKQTQWGSKFLETLSKDLSLEFPDMNGFSIRNLKYCRQFSQFYGDTIVQQAVAPFGQQPVAQIPWGHNILIFSKSRDLKEANFYIQHTLEHHLSRDVLALKIKSNLYERSGKAISNFKATLPDPMSDLAQQTLKDPYIFDFFTMTEPYKERDIEKQLVNHVTKFLLELGKGFAFVGQQYHVSVADNDYYIDLLFYNIRLKCYVVIELKNTKFIPEYAGKLNFYLSAVDSLVKQSDDNATIGILLCRYKNNIEAEFALRDINKPMGVSEFQITEILPENLKSSLPTIEEIENELGNLEE